ncbi:MAG: cytochrome c3 family protein [Deltaproteobacteria bacterium]|nr:cytochrome c3 family protein [Deltaproteobacteria bacterium]
MEKQQVIEERFLSFSALAVAATACAVLTRKPDRIQFPHNHHAEQGLSCADCHQGIDEAKNLTEKRYIPQYEKCLECHDEDFAPAKALKDKQFLTERISSVSFDHSSHMKRVEGGCAVCHSGVEKTTSAGESHRPKMLAECMTCHRSDFRKIECLKCHTDMVDSKEKPMSLFSHDGDFQKRHGNLAKGDSVVCAHCHQDNFCSDCHNKFAPMLPETKFSEKVGLELIHRGDFVTRHYIEAALDPAKCYKCHNQETCSSCHEKSGVSQTGGSLVNPHPKGWMNPASKDFHGDEARKKIYACASCHDKGAASNCITCHKEGAGGGNPHPKGFDSRKDKKSDKVCLFCH